MTTVNKLIQTSDYNNIRNTISTVVGTGSASKGYGQSVNSRTLFNHELVSQYDWDLLRFDILNARIHQVGSATLTEINENELISASISNPYATTTTTADSTAERFKVASGQFLTDLNKISTNREWGAGTTPDTWISEINTIFRVSFNSANDARYFFNSGGEIRISSSRVNPPSGRSHDEAQSTSWTTLLTNAGTQAFGGIYSAISSGGVTRPAQTGLNYYALTTAWTSFYSRVNTSPYQNNRYQLEARVDVANNTAGTASYIEFRIRFIDGYTDPPSGSGVRGFPREVGPEDEVDGLFTVTLDEKRASSTDFNPIVSVLTSASNELSRNTIIVPTADVSFVTIGMRVTSSGGEVGSGKTVQSSSIIGTNTVFVLNSTTDDVVASGIPVTFQNVFSVAAPSYSVIQTLQGS
jgi:hypothetical protein